MRRIKMTGGLNGKQEVYWAGIVDGEQCYDGTLSPALPLHYLDQAQDVCIMLCDQSRDNLQVLC